MVLTSAMILAHFASLVSIMVSISSMNTLERACFSAMPGISVSVVVSSHLRCRSRDHIMTSAVLSFFNSIKAVDTSKHLIHYTSQVIVTYIIKIADLLIKIQ
jgi:hypothetical protein